VASEHDKPLAARQVVRLCAGSFCTISYSVRMIDLTPKTGQLFVFDGQVLFSQ
jgi:hypothetical protein